MHVVMLLVRFGRSDNKINVIRWIKKCIQWSKTVKRCHKVQQQKMVFDTKLDI